VYQPLEAYNETHRNDKETDTATEYELTDTSRNYNEKLNNSGKYNTTAKESPADSSKKPKAQHNLQNSKKNQ
jgi:hypothetical protein